MILLPRQFSSQPQGAVQVDWSNPLTRNLLVARTPGDNPEGNVNLLVDGARPRGRYTTKNGLLSTNSAVGSTSFSFLVLFRTPATLVANSALIGRGVSGGAGNIGFGFNVQQDATYSGAFYVGSSYTPIGKPAGTLVANTEYCIAGTFNGSVGYGYRDGVRTVGPTSATISDTTARLSINCGSNLANQADCLVYGVFYWNRVLSDSEIASVSNNPWQVFKKQSAKLFFHSAATAQTLTPDLFTNNNSFYSATLSASITLSPSLYTNDNTFYTATVSQGGTVLQPDLYTNTNTFYSATISAGAVTLTPSLYTNSNTFYAPTVTSTVTLTPGLYTNDQTFYSPTVTQGAAPQTLTPALYTNTNTFYSATVIPGAVTLTPDLYTNTQAFYSPTVVQATLQTLAPELFVNTNTIFLPVVDDGTRVVSIADVGAEDERRKKRQKKRDKEFALLKQEQSKLRQEIERVIDPVVEQSQPVIVSPTDREVRVLSVSGTQVAVTVPESFDAAQIAREIAQIFEQSRIQATVVERAAQTQQALTQAQEQYRRKMKRRRDDELLLLMD